MATKKISELNALTTPESDDLIAIVDASATETKKITYGNISKHIVNVGTEVEEDSRVNLLETKNLFNKNANIKIGYIDASGNVQTSDTTLSYQDNFILVKPNTTYTISTSVNTIFRMCEYTISRTFIERKMNVGQDASFTFTTSANTYYLKMGGVYTTSISTLQLEEGTTATPYKPFTINEINIDNEKYTDTINVGSVVDNRSRVNVLKSNNLWKQLPNTQTLNGITLTNNENGTFNLSGTATANTSFYTELDLGSANLKNVTYTLSKKSVGYNIQLDFYNGTTYVSTPIYCYGSTLENSATLSIGSNVNKVRYIIYVANGSSVSLTNEQVMFNEGSSALPFEPYVKPSIVVDNDEIYSKPVVLWQNSSTTSNFVGQQITLNDSLANYKHIEINFFDNTSNTRTFATGKIIPKKLTTLFYLSGLESGGNAMIRYREITAMTDTTITFGTPYYKQLGQTNITEGSNQTVPYQVIGYK